MCIRLLDIRLRNLFFLCHFWASVLPLNTDTVLLNTPLKWSWYQKALLLTLIVKFLKFHKFILLHILSLF